MSKRTSLDVRLRIDFAPSGSIGPGKIALLEAIEASGSLSRAARELGMSYRRAWSLLDDLNTSLREPVASASTGGAGGGGARLTAFGRAVIAAYREVEALTLTVARSRFADSRVASRVARAALRRPVTRPLAKHRAAKKRGTKRR